MGTKKLPTKQIERYTAVLQRQGYSAAFGKIFGYLVTATPPWCSFDEIVSDLRLSKGAVSMVLRTMQDRGFVDAVVPLGARKRFFRIATDKWEQGLEQQIATSVQFSELLRESLQDCNPEYREHRRNLAQLLAIEKLFQAKLQEIIRSIRKSELRPARKGLQ